MRTQTQLEEHMRIKPGKFVMLAPHVFMENGRRHPACGKVGKVTSIHGDKAVVEMKIAGDKGSFLILPSEMWIVLPDFYVNIHNAANGYWYELSEQGKSAMSAMDRMGPPK